MADKAVKVKVKLEPDLNHIGVGRETIAIVRAHPLGKGVLIRRDDDHHGGFVLSVTDAEYARIGTFAGEDFITYRHPDDGMIHRSSIEAAVRRAYAT